MSRSAVFLHKYFASKIAMSNLFFFNIFGYHDIISPQPPSLSYSFHHRHNPSNNLTTPRPRVASTRFLSTCVLFLHKRPTPHNAVVSFPAFDGILRTESKVASSISVLATIFTAWINWVTSKLNYLEPSYTYAISHPPKRIYNYKFVPVLPLKVSNPVGRIFWNLSCRCWHEKRVRRTIGQARLPEKYQEPAVLWTNWILSRKTEEKNVF